MEVHLLWNRTQFDYNKQKRERETYEIHNKTIVHSMNKTNSDYNLMYPFFFTKRQSILQPSGKFFFVLIRIISV